MQKRRQQGNKQTKKKSAIFFHPQLNTLTILVEEPSVDLDLLTDFVNR